jgi:LPS O-antigen subunit length determinant protein (WzzB/FepE family)
MEEMSNQRNAYPDDEISLVDIARTLLRRKIWIIATFVVCVLAALAFAITKERQYTYTTSILIGEFGLDKYVAEAQAAKNVLTNRIEPVVARRFVDKRDMESIPFGITVNADEGNNFVNLKSEASEEIAPLVGEFHRAMASALTEDHNQKLSLLDKESSIRLDNLRIALKTEEKQLQSLQKLLSESTRAVEEATTDADVKANTQGTDDGMEATLSSSNNSLTFLLSQMQLTEQLSKRENRINQLRGDIESEELKRSWIKPTRVVDVAVASISPAGTGKTIIVALGVVLGLMLGIFAAFFVEFVSRVRSDD